MKARQMKTMIIPLALSFAIGACSTGKQESSETNIKISASAIASSNSPAAVKAEEYGKAAELLMTAQGLEQADQFLDLALKQDASNLRAGFFKVLLAPILLQKGIIARMAPMYQGSVRGREDYSTLRQDFLDNEKSPAFAKFITEGPADMLTEAEMQKHLDKLTNSLENLQSFLKKHKDSELTVVATTFLVPDIRARYVSACEIKTTAAMEFELVCPDPVTRNEVTMNRADFEFLQDMAAFFEIYIAIGNSYDISGLITSANHQGLAGHEAFQMLLKDSKFGRLRDKQTLSRIQALGLDAENGLRWAMAQQATVCPAGEQRATNRPGKWLNTGFCVHAGYGPYLDILRNTLQGVPQQSVTDRKGDTHTTLMTPMKFLNSPVRDLRQLGPMQFDKCGQLLSVGDPSLGGIFQQGDANRVLSTGAGDCSL